MLVHISKGKFSSLVLGEGVRCTPCHDSFSLDIWRLRLQRGNAGTGGSSRDNGGRYDISVFH